MDPAADSYSTSTMPVLLLGSLTLAVSLLLLIGHGCRPVLAETAGDRWRSISRRMAAAREATELAAFELTGEVPRARGRRMVTLGGAGSRGGGGSRGSYSISTTPVLLLGSLTLAVSLLLLICHGCLPVLTEAAASASLTRPTRRHRHRRRFEAPQGERFWTTANTGWRQ